MWTGSIINISFLSSMFLPSLLQRSLSFFIGACFGSSSTSRALFACLPVLSHLSLLLCFQPTVFASVLSLSLLLHRSLSISVLLVRESIIFKPPFIMTRFDQMLCEPLPISITPSSVIDFFSIYMLTSPQAVPTGYRSPERRLRVHKRPYEVRSLPKQPAGSTSEDSST